jgi:hypothetical protein
MALFLDARIPVVFGAEAGEGDARFVPSAQPAHPVGCTCCAARSDDALALDRLFLARVRGEVPWFRRVVVSDDDPALRAALATDPVLSARFRVAA